MAQPIQAPVGADELGPIEHMRLHPLEHLLPGSGRLQPQRYVEGIECEAVAMRLTPWRTGRAVSGSPKIVGPLNRTVVEMLRLQVFSSR